MTFKNIEKPKINKKMAQSDFQRFINLFIRPLEPVFMPKGPDGEVYGIPESFQLDRWKPFQSNLDNRFGAADKIEVKPIQTLPDVGFAQILGRRENFSIFIPRHRRIAGDLIQVFMDAPDLDEFLSSSVYCRDRVNPYLYVYALSVAILHRPDTANIQIPSLCEVFPEKFMDGEVFARAKEEANIIDDPQSRIPITIPRDYTASDLEIEHRVAYFREDLGINLHHWHWHLVYPFTDSIQIVNKDRRGELFYYMHQQIIARYNFERLSNNLPRVTRLNNFRDPIPEGYFPKMDSLVSSRNWPPRCDNTVLKDVNREADQLRFDIRDLERWMDRVYTAIHNGEVVDNQGRTIPLSESKGIDILGNILEASILSVNPNLYGDLHNFAHNAISMAHDPNNKHLESFGVMGDPATAMRDPVFYRLHAMIDDMFTEYKNTLPQYTESQLNFPGVQVTGVDLFSDDSRNCLEGRNQLFTYWQQDDVDFSNGLDFAPRGSVLARFTHLQHSSFSYNITVESNTSQLATVRIFLAPKFDERGVPMLFRDQKQLFIEMDKFTQRLVPGRNQIVRRSEESNVTIPFEWTFRNLDAAPAQGTQELAQFQFCGCGWPQHMLVPKGNAANFPCQLFVMITNFREDMVEGVNTNQICSDAASFCGLRNSRYPDRRPMGYPFDRLPRAGADTLDQFLTPNMGVRDVSILFTDRTLVPTTPGSRVYV